MHITSTSIEDGVAEERFELGEVPGILWSPAGTSARPLILLAHGGGRHKAFPAVVSRARRYVAAGFAVAALDAPGHGDRPRSAADDRFIAEYRRRVDAGEPSAAMLDEYTTSLAAQAVPEWRTLLDALAPDAVGFYGHSLGARIGVPLVADEPRIRAAVLGLLGHDRYAEAARRITVPVEFLVQWDDELIPRESALALFDAFASTEKTLHANPGPHAGVPLFEVASSVRFFERHLGGA